MPWPPDLLGEALKRSPSFRGKGRLRRIWASQRRAADVRARTLPGGAVITCDVSNPYEASIWLGVEERSELEWMRSQLAPGQTFVDCGANIGLWTLVAAAAVGPQGSVYAFEPNSNARGKLSHHVASLASDHVVVDPRALGRAPGSGYLLQTESANLSHLVADNTSGVEVEIVTLDGALDGRHVDGCKIDVEGSELDVLAGAEEMLAGSRPWCVIEYNSILSGARSLGTWPVHAFLRGRDFEAFTVDGTGPLSESWGISGYCNLFYLPL